MICSIETKIFPLFYIEIILIIIYFDAKNLMKKFLGFYMI